MPQASISDRISKGYAGQVTSAGPVFARAGKAETVLTAGAPLKRGTAKAYQVEPFEAADVPTAGMFAGVAIHSPTREYDSTNMIAIGDPVEVLRFGCVLMSFSEAVTAGEQVGITLATGVLTGIPQGTAAGAITTGIVVLPGLRIVETTTAAGLAEVEVNLFGSQDAATVGTL
jgi:hypothetical protein